MTWTIYLDVDGILLDFFEYALPFFTKETSVKVPKGYMPKNKNLKELMNKKPTFDSLVELLPEDWAHYLKALPNASSFTNKLHKLGARVVLITTVPQRTQIYRLTNLLLNKIYFDELYCVERNDQKAEVILLLNKRGLADKWMFADDVALTVSSVQSVTKQKSKYLLSLDIPYNKDIRAVFPNKLSWFKDLNQLYKYILDTVK